MADEFEKKDKASEGNPPAVTESLGSPEPAEPVVGEVQRDSEAVKEAKRLENIGVRHIEDGTRGVNIKAEGHHLPDPRLCPTKPTGGSDMEEGEYTFQNGETMPANRISSPTVPAPPAPQPGQPAPNFGGRKK